MSTIDSTTPVDFEKLDPSFAGIWKQLDIYSPTYGYLHTQKKAIYLRDAFVEKKLGVPNTAKEQATKLMKLLRYEVSRSEVYRTLLKQIFKSNAVINIFLGKNSAAFVDSADLWTFDFDDLLSLPIDPVTVHIHDHHREHNPKLCSSSAELKCGITQGELLLHILEERFYMGRAGHKYTEAHLKCLSPGSYQNQYRKEMGLQSDLMLMAIHEDGADPLINDKFIPFDKFTHAQGHSEEFYEQLGAEVIPADITLDELSPNSGKPKVALLYTALSSMPVEVVTHAENVMEIGQKHFSTGDFLTLDSLGIVTQLGKLEISKAEYPRDERFETFDSRKLELTMHVLDSNSFATKYIQNKIDILTREIVVKKRIPPMDFPPILLLKHMYEHVHGKETEEYDKAVFDFFGPMVIHFARRQAWTLLNSKFKIIKHGGVFVKLCDLPYLIQSAQDQMQQTCERAGIVVPDDWRTSVLPVPEIEEDIKQIKIRLVPTLTNAFTKYAACIKSEDTMFKLGNEQAVVDALAEVI